MEAVNTIENIPHALAPNEKHLRKMRVPRNLRRLARLARLVADDQLAAKADRSIQLNAIGEAVDQPMFETMGRGAMAKALPLLDETLHTSEKPVEQVMLAGAITQIYKASKATGGVTVNAQNAIVLPSGAEAAAILARLNGEKTSRILDVESEKE